MINTIMEASLFLGVLVSYICPFNCSYRRLCVRLAINDSFDTSWSITTLQVHDKQSSEKHSTIIHYRHIIVHKYRNHSDVWYRAGQAIKAPRATHTYCQKVQISSICKLNLFNCLVGWNA